MSTATLTRRNRCSYCHELKPDVSPDSKLCESCEQDHTYCHVCDAWNSPYGNGCRHIGWSDEYGCNAGCGTYDISAEEHRESFDVLLAKFAPLRYREHEADLPLVSNMLPLLPRMRELISENNFWTQWHGPLIGGYPDLALRYEIPGRDFYPTLRDIRASEQLGWGDEAIEQMQLGMAWLTSLDHKSVDANRLTAQWIDEWMQRSLLSGT